MSETDLQTALERIEATLAKLVRERTRPPSEAVSIRQAASLLGIDRCRTLPALIAAGTIRTVEIAGHVRVPRSEIERVLREGAPLACQQKPRGQRMESVADEVAAIMAIRVR